MPSTGDTRAAGACGWLAMAQRGFANFTAWPAGTPGLVLAACFRGVVCLLAWAPPPLIAQVVFPSFRPMFERLHERGELPGLTSMLGTWVHVNEQWLYLPLAFLLLVLLQGAIVVELATFLLRRTPLRRWWAVFWLSAVAIPALVAWGVVLAGLLLPVLRSQASVV
jgi:hypothetical protein